MEKIEYVPRNMFTTQTLGIDIMFVEGEPYLISLSKPLQVLMATHLKGPKMASTLAKAIEGQVAEYKAQGFEVRGIMSDGEEI